jgi:archaellum component FlaC
MSTLGDAVSALKNVVLMQERLDVVRTEISGISSRLGRLNEKVSGLELRIVRIETLIESASGRAGSIPRLEGN